MAGRVRLAAGVLCGIVAAAHAAGAGQLVRDRVTQQMAQRPPAPPALPGTALTLVPLTLELRTVGGDAGAAGGTRRITRTRDRVHVRIDARREWLYVRNPVDARRVTGFLVDHTDRVIVVYEESDLRNQLGIRGWLDVITLGVDYGALAPAATRATSEIRTAHGRAFVRRGARTPDGTRTSIWWNDDDLLALDTAGGPTAGGAPTPRTTLVSIEPRVDDTLLAPLLTRFPTYHQVDYADWLEHRHER